MQNSDVLVCDGSLRFPMQVGNKHSYKDYPATTGRSKYNATCEIIGQEKITVSAGIFDTLRIDCAGFYTRLIDGNWTAKFNSVTWYSPAINRIVKAQYFDSTSGGAAFDKNQTELVEFTAGKYSSIRAHNHCVPKPIFHFPTGISMNTFFKTFAATAFAVFTTTAYAQSTVGELIDGGAKKMTKEQLVTYIAGTKLTGPNRSGEIVMNIDLKADGSFSGSVNNPQRGISTGTFGKWAVDESGKTCTDGRLSAWNMSFKEYFF